LEVKAEEAIYSKDKKLAQVRKPTGELFRMANQFTKSPRSREQSNRMASSCFLGSNCSNRSSERFGGNGWWIPQSDLLIVRNQLTGTHRQVQAVAQEARVLSLLASQGSGGKATNLATANRAFDLANSRAKLMAIAQFKLTATR